jgi:hypothetical protein
LEITVEIAGNGVKSALDSLQFYRRGQNLIGGGLIRSEGGWSAIKDQRIAKIYQKGDERILGDGDFVEQILSAANEEMKWK